MKEKELKEIFLRKCCRQFDISKEITKDDLELIMKAGQSAPSAKNRQPYYFVAIINRECRKEIYMAAENGRRKQFAVKSAFSLRTKGWLIRSFFDFFHPPGYYFENFSFDEK